VSNSYSLKLRLAVIYSCFFLFFVLIFLRLIQLQILNNPGLDELAKKQFNKTEKVSPYRLPIFDRNGEELAVSIPSVSIFARPKLIKDKYKSAIILSRITGEDYGKIISKLNSDKNFVWISRQIDKTKSAKITKLKKLRGIYTVLEHKRVYPNGQLAAHILGFTDIDGNGISGIELSLNKELLSKPLVILSTKDGKGKPSYIKNNLELWKNKPGISLTIDKRIQFGVEEEIEIAKKELDAESIFAIIMNPINGQILAMAITPTFDPNFPNKFPLHLHVNKIISHLFEPGSVMKVFFIAEGIEEGLITPNSSIDCGKGRLKIGRKVFTEAEKSHSFNFLSVKNVIKHSSNIGAINIVRELGADKISSVLQKFGFTQKTEIELPGETMANIKPESYWTKIHMATSAFGQGISVTPLQLISAYTPFANGGFWVRPQLIRSSTENRLNVKRIISKQTALEIRKILMSVVEEDGGTGSKARIKKIKVGGKTGTAQKYIQGEGYRSKKYFSSFIGFFPADAPKLLMAVMINEPKKKYYASETAAPLFRKIAERILQYTDINENYLLTNNSKADIQTKKETPTISKTEDNKVILPNLKGLSLKAAIDLLSPFGIEVNAKGSGYIVNQEPIPGSIIALEKRINVTLSAKL